MAWDSERTEPAITPIFESRVGAIVTRPGMRASRDGRRALFALGNIDTPGFQAVEIEEGAALVAPASTLALSGTPWDCLAVVATDEAAALSTVVKPEAGNEVVWQLRELDADANTVLETSATVPVGDALGYTDCPTVIESPDGYHAQWVNLDNGATLATLRRDAEPGTPPELVSLDTTPGVLVGALRDELLFLARIDDDHQGFVRWVRAGVPVAPPVVLPMLPESTSERRRLAPKLLSVEGSSLFVSYELESVRVIEEISCP
jgi:hypothetical protein